MFTQIAVFLIDTVVSFFVFMLLARFHFQWLRVPFRNPVGEFVLATTSWAVLPAPPEPWHCMQLVWKAERPPAMAKASSAGSLRISSSEAERMRVTKAERSLACASSARVRSARLVWPSRPCVWLLIHGHDG